MHFMAGSRKFIFTVWFNFFKHLSPLLILLITLPYLLHLFKSTENHWARLFCHFCLQQQVQHMQPVSAFEEEEIITPKEIAEKGLPETPILEKAQRETILEASLSLAKDTVSSPLVSLWNSTHHLFWFCLRKYLFLKMTLLLVVIVYSIFYL